MRNQLSVFVKPPTSAFEEKNPERDPWSKWHWHDAAADWNWSGHEGSPIEVSVYSSCPEVELFLNGKSLGRKKTDRSTEFMAKWEVPYQPGVLRAVGLQGRRTLNTAELRTADEPLNIHFSADRREIKADGQDLSYITVELRDNKGVRHPKAENLIRFEIEGPGEIVAVGNANPVSLESYQQPQRKAWQGRCMVIVKSNGAGEITLRATSDGLKPAQVIVVAR
jgi:beta-galactosidase